MDRNKTCLVFGGSGALGSAVCRALHGKGAKVAFTYCRSKDRADALLAELPGTRAHELDLGDLEQIEGTIARAADGLGGIDAFVQCAALAVTAETEGPVHERMEDIGPEGFDRLMDVNVKSTFFALKSLALPMARRGGGNVVLIGSIDGVKIVPSPVAYAATKGALVGMTQAAAKELGGEGIRVNTVAPGVMDRGVSRHLPDDLREEYLKHCGLQRFGRVEEVASVVAWFALENTYVTGQTILVDGAL